MNIIEKAEGFTGKGEQDDQVESRLKSADNTGARELQCIKVLGGLLRKFANIGDVIVCSVKEGTRWRCKKVKICRCHRPHKARCRRKDAHIKFDENAAVIIREDKNPGTRILAPSP